MIDYLGQLDGEPFDGGEGRDQLLELGARQLIPGFEEQLVGAGAGEGRTVEVTFPERLRSRAPRRQGGDVRGHGHGGQGQAAARARRRVRLEAAGFDTLAELREDIAGRLAESEEHDDRARVRAGGARCRGRRGGDRGARRAGPRARARAASRRHSRRSRARASRKEAYLRITGKDEEELAQRGRARGRPAAATRGGDRGGRRGRADRADRRGRARWTPSGDRPSAARRPPRSCSSSCARAGGSSRLRADVAAARRSTLLVREAKPITVEQAKAREQAVDAREGRGPGRRWAAVDARQLTPPAPPRRAVRPDRESSAAATVDPHSRLGSHR